MKLMRDEAGDEQVLIEILYGYMVESRSWLRPVVSEQKEKSVERKLWSSVHSNNSGLLVVD